MKKIIYLSITALLGLWGCAGNSTSEQPTVENKINNVPFRNPNAANATESEAKTAPAAALTFDTKGGINPKEYKGGETATISFSEFPKDLNSFKQAQEKLGTTPEGAVLLELFAFEIYNHNHAEGEECLKLANVSNNISSVLRILKDRYNPAFGDYYTPQLVATFLEGATPENAYKANKPYKVTIRSHKSLPYEDSNTLKGTVLKLEVFSNGYDTQWRGVSVVKAKGEQFFKIVNNPSMYTQCKPVSFKIDDEYTDIWNQ